MQFALSFVMFDFPMHRIKTWHTSGSLAVGRGCQNLLIWQSLLKLCGQMIKLIFDCFISR